MDDGGSGRLEGRFVAMVVCWFLGIGSLVSWNSVLTIGDYYYQVFPDYHTGRLLIMVYMVFALVVIGILAYNEANVDTRRRNISGYTIFFLGTLGLLLIDLGTSGKGGIGNFIGVCVFVASFGVADAQVQGGMMGDLSFMCSEFCQSYLAGLAASGTLTSGLRLITKAAFERSTNGLRKGAILFLGISSLLEFLCVFLYALIFAKLPVVKYFRKKASLEGSKTVIADLAVAGIHVSNSELGIPDRLSNKQLLVQNIDYVIDVFVIYALTVSIIPGFLYENTGNHELGSWYPITLIAMYNVSDLIGRYMPLINGIRLKSRKGLLAACLARLLFTPCFYFTAKKADAGWMILLIGLFGLTNGYLTVCIFSIAPKGYKAPEQNALGNLLVFSVFCGLLLGAALDWLWLIGNGSF